MCILLTHRPSWNCNVWTRRRYESSNSTPLQICLLCTRLQHNFIILNGCLSLLFIYPPTPLIRFPLPRSVFLRLTQLTILTNVQDDWLDLLPRFPKLQVFRGDGLWHAVNGEKQDMHAMLMEITLKCPHLRELDHCDFYNKFEAYKRITFKREGEEEEKVSYTITKPPPRYVYYAVYDTF